MDSEKVAAAEAFYQQGNEARKRGQWFYQQGNEARKRGQWHEAINNYIQAIALDPDSPAVEAKRMLDDIMAFYCKDMYNP